MSLDFIKKYGTYLLVVAMFVGFGVVTEHFFDAANIINILKQISIVAIVSIGMTMVVLIGGIDLSVGSVVLLSGVVTGGLLTSGLPIAPAVLAGLLSGCLFGFLNGVFIEKFRIAPVIVTLGVMMAARGIAVIILGAYGKWIWIKNPALIAMAEGRILGLPAIVFVMFVLYAVAFFMLRNTIFGKNIYAIGGNECAANLCGIRVVRNKVAVYVVCGLFAAVAGVLLSARMTSISPVMGLGLEFDAVTAVILGGTSMKGGKGRIEKTLLGSIMVGLILNFLTLKGISPYYQKAVTGFVILAAATADRLAYGKSE